MEKHSKLKNKKRKKNKKQNKTGVVVIDIDNLGDSFAGVNLKKSSEIDIN